MTEEEKQEIMQSIDLDSIAESVQAACLGVLNALQKMIPKMKKSLENGEMNEYIKQEIARRIVDELEKSDG